PGQAPPDRPKRQEQTVLPRHLDQGRQVHRPALAERRHHPQRPLHGRTRHLAGRTRQKPQRRRPELQRTRRPQENAEVISSSGFWLLTSDFFFKTSPAPAAPTRSSCPATTAAPTPAPPWRSSPPALPPPSSPLHQA